MSQAAKRAHFAPGAFSAIENRCRPNSFVSFAATMLRNVFVPSPQTSSTKFSGNVHSTSASAEIFEFESWTPRIRESEPLLSS